ncbi:MAG: DUF1501 domain-containing protein [Planctomycetaceae bacterium]|nr:DUF1501 domain-containing protein [Planctomycetaceae bacterium]
MGSASRCDSGERLADDVRSRWKNGVGGDACQSLSEVCHMGGCGRSSRREWLTIGGLHLGALACGLSPNLAGLLAAAERTSSSPPDPDLSVILVWANGGPSHIDLFDLKPQAPREYRGPFRPIGTTVPGMEISELLPQLAAQARRFTLIRSLHHERNQHSGGTHRFLTGYSSVAANLPRSEYPEIGSIVARQVEGESRGVPAFVANTPFYGGGPAYLGPAYEAFMPAPNYQTASGANTYDPVPLYPTPDTLDSLSSLGVSAEGVLTVDRRRDLLTSLDRLPGALDRSGSLEALDLFRRQALEIVTSGRTRDAFDLTREPDEMRRRYGEGHLGRSLLTCRRLVEAGVRFVQCQATYRLRPETGRTSNWDDHSVNADIFQALGERLPSLDQALATLIADIHERGLDQKVLVLFCGEFGRTPKIAYQDASGRPGRDHWCQAMSVLVSGGGLRMGQVIGATGPKAEEPVDRAMDSSCLLATIYQRFGIDYHRAFLDNTGRPIPILTDGHPIKELL